MRPRMGYCHRKRNMDYAVKDIKNILGTFVKITIIHPDVDEAMRALRAAFDEIYRIQDLMNIYCQNSELGVLNREGRCGDVSKDTKYVIQRANYFSELSEGAFDITVLPVLKLWEESARTKKMPEDAEISRTLELVNYRDIVLEDDYVAFRKAGMGITLAGVAKGYAVDRAVETLRKGYIRHALVNAGGDIRALGGKNDIVPWKVVIRDPVHKARSLTTVELYDQAIATSGAYQRPFNDIISPKEGKPAQGVLSATAIANRTIDADILATCLFVLGADNSIGLLKEIDGANALILKSDETIVRGAGPFIKKNEASEGLFEWMN